MHIPTSDKLVGSTFKDVDSATLLPANHFPDLLPRTIGTLEPAPHPDDRDARPPNGCEG